jgi:tetratricopeptide (TPR) repeat protein
VLFSRGEYENVLSHLKHLYDKGYYTERGETIRNQSLTGLEQEGDRAYVNQEYKTAAQKFNTLLSYQQIYQPEVLAKLIYSYRQTANYNAAIQVYEQVIKKEPRTIEARIGLGGLYAEHLREYAKALVYYEQASKLVEDEYVSVYGKAFPLAMNPANAPDSHYDLHCGLARVLISMGEHKRAESALKWAIFLRPGKPLAYYLMGLRHREARNLKAACEAMTKASSLGYTKANEYLPFLCKSPKPGIDTAQVGTN